MYFLLSFFFYKEIIAITQPFSADTRSLVVLLNVNTILSCKSLLLFLSFFRCRMIDLFFLEKKIKF